jgi:hypothetical protein
MEFDFKKNASRSSANHPQIWFPVQGKIGLQRGVPSSKAVSTKPTKFVIGDKD